MICGNKLDSIHLAANKNAKTFSKQSQALWMKGVINAIFIDSIGMLQAFYMRHFVILKVILVVIIAIMASSAPAALSNIHPIDRVTCHKNFSKTPHGASN
jgi:hypothetical protein